MTSRLRVSVIQSGRFSRRRVSLILVPSGPRISFTASISDMSLVNSSSILMIWSPGLTPARNAGVSSIGETTVSTPLRCVISMPRPPKLPRVSTCSSLYRSGRQIGAVRVERREHAVDRAVDELLGGDVVDVVLLHHRQHVRERLDVRDTRRGRPPRPVVPASCSSAACRRRPGERAMMPARCFTVMGPPIRATISQEFRCATIRSGSGSARETVLL